MPFAVVGVDHTTAPVAIREPLALAPQSQILAMEELRTAPDIDEISILVTCARTEAYLWSDDRIGAATSQAVRWLETLSPQAGPYIRVRAHVDAVRHIFRVTAGLESRIVGEQEVAAQVRSSIHQARARATLGPRLDALFRAAVSCSRRLRSEALLGSVDASVGPAAAALLDQKLDIRQSRILILGTGRIARSVAGALRGAAKMTIAGRTQTSARSLADSMGADWTGISEALGGLRNYDAVLCATRSGTPLIGPREVRDAAPLILFDLSVPRNVEPEVASVSSIDLYDVDSIGSRSARDTELIESILAAEEHDFLGRESSRQVAPIIAALRAHVEDARRVELERIGHQLHEMDPRQRAAVEGLTERLIDRMFHHLVVRLKLAALTDPNLISAAEFFFAHGDETLFPSAEAPIVQREEIARRRVAR